MTRMLSKKEKEKRKKELMQIYGQEKLADESDFVEMVRKSPTPKRIMEEAIAGVPIDLSAYENFQVIQASPFDLETVTALNSAYVYKEAMAYAPHKFTDYGKYIVWLLMAAVIVPIGLYIASKIL